jgi:DNA-binding transcriptional regulator YiaG
MEVKQEQQIDETIESEGITSTELATRLGVDPDLLGSWWSGKSKPSKGALAAEFANWERRGSGTKTRWYRKK